MRGLLVAVLVTAFLVSVSTGHLRKRRYWRRRPAFNLARINCDRIKRADLCHCCKDPCDDVECLNNGVCVNGICNCPCGFSGTDCGVDLCAAEPCQNGETCVPEADGVTCKCAEGFTADNCEVDLCAAKLCQNNGTCVPEADGASCKCADGFTGDNCEVDMCASCQNNGTCVREAGGVSCKCVAGFTGEFCEKDECEPNPCQNCGKCSRIEGGFKCVCLERIYGTTCEVIDNIIMSPKYPDNYPAESTLQVLIPECPGKQIRIVFDDDFVIQKRDRPQCEKGSSLVEYDPSIVNCEDAFTIDSQVYDNTICGGTPPQPIITPGAVAIRFEEFNDGVECMGFNLSYSYVDA